MKMSALCVLAHCHFLKSRAIVNKICLTCAFPISTSEMPDVIRPRVCSYMLHILYGKMRQT